MADRPSIYFPTLDGLRFFAFFLVFIHHLPRSPVPILGFLHDQGWVGVHIFFALSAYLLTRILLLEKETSGRVSIRRFYGRRCLRLWPLYFLFCTGAALYALAAGSWRADYAGRYFGLIAFVDNIVSGLTWYNPIPWTSHLWTVSVEEQFYLVFPFLFVLGRKGSGRLLGWLAALWGLFIGIRVVCVLCQAGHPFIWTSLFSADALLLGTALAALRWQPSAAVSARLFLVLGAIAGCFGAGLFPALDVTGAHQVFLYALVAVGAGLLLLAALHEPGLGFLSIRPLRYLGKISYGLYVFHFLSIHLAGSWWPSGSWWLHAGAALVVTVALAAASYALIEKHFLALKMKYEAVLTRPV